jgi:hypothetical protein
MIALRRLGSVLFCGWIGAWIARAAFHWVLDVSRTWEIAALVTGAAVGGIIGLAAALEQEADGALAPPRGPRDAALSGMAVTGGVAAIAAVFVLAFPWGLATVAVLLGATVATLYWWSPDR